MSISVTATALRSHNYNSINATLFILFTVKLTSTNYTLCLAQEVLVGGHAEVTRALK